MNRILKLNNGQAIPIKMCGKTSSFLWIHAMITMAEACQIFSVPENISTIVDTYEDNEELRSVTWEGFTSLVNLSIVDDDDFVRIALKEASNGTEES